jgi:hypothetical protein
MTRLLRFDPLQRATEFICRLMLEAGACVRKCPEGQTIAGGWAHVGAGACVRREGRATLDHWIRRMYIAIPTAKRSSSYPARYPHPLGYR